MSGTTPSRDPRGHDDDVAPVSGEIVREQTVRARMPTQRYSGPALAAEVAPQVPAVSGETVRAPIPTAPEGTPTPRAFIDTPAAPMPLDLHEAEELEAELDDDAELELEEVELVDERAEPGPLRRDDPPAASGEVVVSAEPEPQPAAGPRPTTLPSGQVPDIGRADPPAVTGEVQVRPSGDAIELAAGPSSGPQPAMPWPPTGRPSTDPGSYVRSRGAETTGPQPRAQAEITGPHPVLSSPRASADSSATALWIVAGALVLLAMTVLGFVLTW